MGLAAQGRLGDICAMAAKPMRVRAIMGDTQSMDAHGFGGTNVLGDITAMAAKPMRVIPFLGDKSDMDAHGFGGTRNLGDKLDAARQADARQSGNG